MILFELTNDEGHPVYEKLAISNGNRQFDFLVSIVEAATDIGRPFLSEHVIKALNFQAITCLHFNAGEYRPCQVYVGPHVPPEHYRVDSLMEDFVNTVNRFWTELDAVALSAFVLWRLNYIHPFINGNGRTARAACYFVLCLHTGHVLPGLKSLPELIKRDHDEYVEALRAADESFKNGALNLAALHTLLSRLIQEQIDSVPNDDPAAPAEPV